MERMHYIDSEDRLVIETVYDPTEVLEQNALERAACPEFGRYKTDTPAGLVKVASIPEEHIVTLRNKGYDVFSPDPDQRRRALLYIQQNEPAWLTVSGTPFAAQRPKWR